MLVECMLDLLDLYTHHRATTLEGTSFPLDKYISVRIGLNNEANAADWPRFVGCSDAFNRTWSTAPSPNEPDMNGGRSSTKTSPTSPAAAGAPSRGKGEVGTPTGRLRGEVHTPTTPRPPVREPTMRFMLDRDRAMDEKAVVDLYMEDSEEEYEVEVEEEYEVTRRYEDDDRYEGRERRNPDYSRRSYR